MRGKVGASWLAGSLNEPAPSTVSLREPPSPPRGEGRRPPWCPSRPLRALCDGPRPSAEAPPFAGHSGIHSPIVTKLPGNFRHIAFSRANLSAGESRPLTLRAIPSAGRASDPTFLDDGGLWSSDEARAEESPGVLEGRDGSCPLARRAPSGRADGVAIATLRPSRRGSREAVGAIRQRPERRAASRRACGKRPRGAVCFVETVTTHLNRARPGCPAPSPTLRACAPGRERLS